MLAAGLLAILTLKNIAISTAIPTQLGCACGWQVVHVFSGATKQNDSVPACISIQDHCCLYFTVTDS